MTPRLAATVLSIAFFVSLPSGTHAQSDSVEDSDARALFNLGEAAFDQGRLQAALDYFQQAYDLSHRPQLLYNIGQAADRPRDDRRALAAFEGFLAQVPESPQHAQTRSRVEVLRAAVAAADAREAAVARDRDAVSSARTTTTEAAIPAPAAATSPSVTNDSSEGSTAGWIVAGGGVAALAVGGTFLALGLRDTNTVEDAADGTTFATVSDEYDRASTRVTVGTILLGVGAAAGATGLALALRGGSSDDEPTALELRVLPTGFLLRRTF